MAPELLKGREYNGAADVFSYGIVLCQVIGRTEADPDVMPRNGNFTVNEAAFTTQFAGDCPPHLLQLAFHCCALKPQVVLDILIQHLTRHQQDRPDFFSVVSNLRIHRLREDQWIVQSALRDRSHDV